MPKRKPVTTYADEITETHRIARVLEDGIVVREYIYRRRQFTVSLFGQKRTLTFEEMAPENSDLCAHLRGKWIARNQISARFRTGGKIWPADIEVSTVDVERLVGNCYWYKLLDGAYAYRTRVNHLNRNESNITCFGWADDYPPNALRD
jgi:hypothetical protein